jgi:hypothetical protein
MGRAWLVVASLLIVLLAAAPAAADPIPLPPPPTLPPTNPPASLQPYLVVAGPTAGAVCGTASLGALLVPSLVQGYFDIPLNSLVSGHLLTQYADSALYICGFIPAPLTPTECGTDEQIIDAVRDLNPLAAQVVGLYPEGATVDTILDIEQLLPSSAGVAQPVADQLAATLHCTRAGAVPPVPGATTSPPGSGARRPLAGAPATTSAPAAPAGSVVVAPVAPGPSPATPAALPVAATPEAVAAPVAAAPSDLRVLETKLVSRHGLQWLALILGILLLALAVGARVWAREDA